MRSARGTTSAPPATRSTVSNLRAPGPGAPIVVELPDVKSGGPDYPASDGDAAPRAHPDPARARRRGGREHPVRREGHVARAGRRPRRGVRQRRVGGRLRPARRRRRTELDRARHHRHRVEARSPPAWASGARSSRARPRCVRTELYYGGPVYIAGYTPTGEDSMYAFLVEKAAGPVRHARRRGDADHARRVACVRRSVELDPRRPRGRRARQLHLVHPAHRAGAVEPRACRRDRGCRAQLPPDDRAGRRSGARGRARAHRAARRPGRRRPGPVGRRSTRAGCRARSAWSRHPCSSASGSSTACAMRMSRACMFGIALEMAKPA